MNFNNYEVLGPISSGANATVYKAWHRFLGRYSAIKVYDKKKPNDKRDKILQGILESQKAAHAQSPQVVEVYDAGVNDEKYFTIMEYFESKTLDNWLEQRHRPNMTARTHLCRHVTIQLFALAEIGFFHGDLHAQNILVGNDKMTDQAWWVKGRTPCPDYRIIDFGTSEFSGEDFSLKRHWRVFHKTYKLLLHPFDIDQLHPVPKPPIGNFLELFEWYNSFVAAVPWFLAHLGRLHPLGYFHGPFSSRQINERVLQSLLSTKPDFETDDFMGDDHDWGTFDYGGYESMFEQIRKREELAKENAEKVAAKPWWKAH